MIERPELPLLDPQVAREFGIVAPNLLDQPLGSSCGTNAFECMTPSGKTRRESVVDD
jgi:hypothetical protein